MKVKTSESRIKYHSSHCTKILTFVTQFLWMLVSYDLNCSCSKLSTSILSGYGQRYLNLDIFQTEPFQHWVGMPQSYTSNR